MTQTFVVDEDGIYATSEIIPKFYTGEGPDSTVKKVHASKKDAEYYDRILSATFSFHAPASISNKDS